jgi:hypothetical protein
VPEYVRNGNESDVRGGTLHSGSRGAVVIQIMPTHILCRGRYGAVLCLSTLEFTLAENFGLLGIRYARGDVNGRT